MAQVFNVSAAIFFISTAFSTLGESFNYMDPIIGLSAFVAGVSLAVIAFKSA